MSHLQVNLALHFSDLPAQLRGKVCVCVFTTCERESCLVKIDV